MVTGGLNKPGNPVLGPKLPLPLDSIKGMFFKHSAVCLRTNPHQPGKYHENWSQIATFTPLSYFSKFDIFSYFNFHEIQTVMDYLEKLVGNKVSGYLVKGEDVVILTPYRKQVILGSTFQMYAKIWP